MMVVIESGILMKVALACRDILPSVKKEAIYLVGNLLIKLSNLHKYDLIK